jgi:hypothetical protein
VSADDDNLTVTVGVPPDVATVNAMEPVTPSLDAVIIAVPPATADTTPELETVATLGAELDQMIVRPVSTVPCPSMSVTVTGMVCPTDNDVPIADSATEATGAAVTVIEIVPLFPSLVAVTVAVPAPTAVTCPLGATVRADGLLLDHVTVRPDN